MDCQDWTTVCVKRPRKDQANRPVFTNEAIKMRKIDLEERPVIKTISNETRQQIIQARVLNKWNQSQLNAACAFPSHMIRDIESGKIQPNPHQLNTLSRVLKITLKYE